MRWTPSPVAFLAGTFFGLQWTLGIVLSLLGVETLDAPSSTPVVRRDGAHPRRRHPRRLPSSRSSVPACGTSTSSSRRPSRYGLLVALFVGLTASSCASRRTSSSGPAARWRSVPSCSWPAYSPSASISYAPRARRQGEPRRLRTPIVAVRGDVGVRRPRRRHLFDGGRPPRMAQLLGEATGAHESRVWLRVSDELRPRGRGPPMPLPSPRDRSKGRSCPTTSRVRPSRSVTRKISSAR